MSKIFNDNHKGKSIVTAIGLISFDENGIAEVNDEEMVEKLLQLDGYKRPEGEEISDQTKQSEQPQNEIKQPEVKDNSSEEQSTQENDEEALDDEEEVDEEEVDEEKVEGEELTEEVLIAKNVPQLRKIAKDNSIDLNGATKKDEIIAIILGSMK